MSTEEQQFELFEQFLEGTLSSEEQNAFEQRLSVDSEFSEAFALYRDMSTFLEHDISEEKTKFSANLKNIGDDYFKELAGEDTDLIEPVTTQETKVIKMRPMYYSIAAAVALLIGFFIYQNSGSALPGDFTYSDRISLTERGAADDALAKAETAFNNKNFVAAIEHFSTVLENDSNNVELQFYKALSHDAILQFDEADALFSRLIAGNSTYKYKATFYQGISQWKRENSMQAKTLLTSIPENSDLYKKAQKALKNID